MATSTYEVINTYTATGNVSYIDFGSISSTYTDLVIKGQYKYQAGAGLFIAMQYNSDTGANYNMEYFYSNGTSVAGDGVGTDTIARIGNGSATLWSSVDVNIAQYKNTNMYKTSISKCSAPNYYTISYCSTWRNTNAITSIRILTDPSATGFVSGSTFTLYGIKAA